MFLMKEIADEYRNEIVAPRVEDRQGCFANLEDALQRALRDVQHLKTDMEKKTAGPTGGNRVKDLIRFHEQQQSQPREYEELGKRIIQLRQWLHRQGAKLSNDGRIMWSKTTPSRILYDFELEKQELTKVQIRGNLFYLPDGKLLDTKMMVTAFSGPGYAIYVVSAEGNMHVGSHRVGQRHHSSLLAGNDVACAGEIQVQCGILKRISNKSGHYKPDYTHLAQILRYFASVGQLQLENVQVDVMGPFGGVFRSAKTFLDTACAPVLPAPAGYDAVYMSGSAIRSRPASSSGAPASPSGGYGKVTTAAAPSPFAAYGRVPTYTGSAGPSSADAYLVWNPRYDTGAMT